jgi:hypothetical protein
MFIVIFDVLQIIIFRISKRGDLLPTTDLPECSHNLEYLQFHDSPLGGRELLSMLPSQKPPVLNKFILTRVSGLTRDDIKAFLTQVASTLQTLYLIGCRFDSSVVEGPFYYVIDELMPLLNVLRELQIYFCPNIITAASLRLKPTRIPGSKIWYRESVESRQVLEALVECEWEAVSVAMRGDNSEIAEVRRVAASQGIVFSDD